MIILWGLLFVAVWLALQLYILPKLGIPTCLCGSCGIKKDDKCEKPEKQA
jgi:hypothetical protein